MSMTDSVLLARFGQDINRIADNLEKIAVILESNVHINIDHAHIDHGEIDVHSKSF